MTTAQKFSFSLLISIVLATAFGFLAYSDLFSLLETQYYAENVLDQYEKQGRLASTEYLRYRDSVALELAEVAKSGLASLIKVNIDRESFLNQTQVLSTFFDTWRLDGLRLIDNQGLVHYSTYVSDILSESAGRRIYKAPEQVISELPLEDFVGLEPKGQQFIAKSDTGSLFWTIDVLDELNIYWGTLIAYSNIDRLTGTMRNIFADPSAELTLMDKDKVLANGKKPSKALINSLGSLWGKNFSIIFEGDRQYAFLFYSDEVAKVEIAVQIPAQELQLPEGIKFFLLGIVFVSLFLLIFIVFNLKQDTVVVLTHRIKKLQVNVLQEYMANRGNMDEERWLLELQTRREEVRQLIQKGLGKRKANKAQTRALIDAGWDEILDIIGTRAQAPGPALPPLDIQKLEGLIEKVLLNLHNNPSVPRISAKESSTASKIPTSKKPSSKKSPPEVNKIPQEPTPKPMVMAPVKSADGIEDLEDVEEIEALDEIEEVGSLDDVEEAEAIDEDKDLDEAEEVEEAYVADETSDIDEAEEAEEIEEVEEVGDETLDEIDEVGSLDDVEEAEAIDEDKDLDEADEVEEAEEIEEVEEVGDEALDESDEDGEADDVEEAEAIDEDKDLDEADEVEEAELADETTDIEEAEEIEEVEEVGDEALDEIDEVGELDDVEEADAIEETEDLDAADEADETSDLDEVEEIEELQDEDGIEIPPVPAIKTAGPVYPVYDDNLPDLALPILQDPATQVQLLQEIPSLNGLSFGLSFGALGQDSNIGTMAVAELYDQIRAVLGPTVECRRLSELLGYGGDVWTFSEDSQGVVQIVEDAYRAADDDGWRRLGGDGGNDGNDEILPSEQKTFYKAAVIKHDDVVIGVHGLDFDNYLQYFRDDDGGRIKAMYSFSKLFKAEFLLLGTFEDHAFEIDRKIGVTETCIDHFTYSAPYNVFEDINEVPAIVCTNDVSRFLKAFGPGCQEFRGYQTLVLIPIIHGGRSGYGLLGYSAKLDLGSFFDNYVRPLRRR